MSKYLTEILEEINDDTNAIQKYKDNTALRLLFEYAYDPEKKMVLPEGNPPYKEDAAPLGMSPANLVMEMKKLYVFCREDLSALRRETLFVQLLEGLHPTEAKLVLAIKDQDLSTLYKNLTHKFAYDHGYVSVEPVEKAKKERKKYTKRGQKVSQEEGLSNDQA
jgi:hypothetical protein